MFEFVAVWRLLPGDLIQWMMDAKKTFIVISIVRASHPLDKEAAWYDLTLLSEKGVSNQMYIEHCVFQRLKIDDQA